VSVGCNYIYITFCPICLLNKPFSVKVKFPFSVFPVVSLLHICQCLLVEKERVVLLSDTVSGEDVGGYWW
jgi:hypothetical protein